MGSAPKDLALSLYEVARFKRRNVHVELKNSNWIRNFHQISVPPNLRNSPFYSWLWQKLILMAKMTQSIGTGLPMESFLSPLLIIGSSMVLLSHSQLMTFGVPILITRFAWLVMHNKVLTAENMLKKHWPCNQFCSFCLCCQETTPHMLTECNYTEAVWNIVATSLNLPCFSQMHLQGGPVQWFQSLLHTGPAGDKKKRAGFLLTVWWLLWKERNRRIFDHRERSSQCLAYCILEAVSLFNLTKSS
jgi:hypothetical protein